MLYYILCSLHMGTPRRAAIGFVGRRSCDVITSTDSPRGCWTRASLWLCCRLRHYILGDPSSVRAQMHWRVLLNPMMNCTLSFPSWMEERTYESDRTWPDRLFRYSPLSPFID